MKKLLILSVFAAIAIAGCKKKEGTVSDLHSYSAPTIIVPGGIYYSIPVGGVLPDMAATAYDSFYNEAASVVYDQVKLDNTVPGVYPVIASAKNRYGMGSSKTIYVAVTAIDPLINLAGKYRRAVTNETVEIKMVAKGFYWTSDVAAEGTGDTSLVVPVHFVQTSTTMIVIPEQPTKFGMLYGTEATVSMAPGDTTIQYTIRNNAFAPSVRTFKKL